MSSFSPIPFKDFRKTLVDDKFLYLSINKNVEFTTMLRIGTRYDSLNVEKITTIADKIIIYLK